MKFKKYCILLAAALTVSISSSASAGTGTSTDVMPVTTTTATTDFNTALNTQKPDAVSNAYGTDKTLTSAEMIDILYENETNETIRKAAKDLTLVLTGEAEPAHVYSNGLVEIGTYPRDFIGHMGSYIELLTTGELGYTSDDNTISVFLMENDSLSNDTAKTYRARLELIYNKVMEAKDATAGMNTDQTIRYLADLVANTFSYSGDVRCGLAISVETGAAKCDEYTGYFYILAKNCGIDVSCRCGTYQSAPHGWNTVTINGSEFVVDTTIYDHRGYDMFLMMPAEQYKIQNNVVEVKDNRELRKISTTYS